MQKAQTSSVPLAEPLDIDALALIYRALSNPHRLRILEYLRRQPNCQTKEAMEATGLAQATVSQHLTVLLKAGLVQRTQSGRNAQYCLNTHTWLTCASTLNSHLNNLATASVTCEGC